MVVNENEKKQSAETKDTRQGVSSFLNSSQKDAAKSKSNLIEIPSISLPKSSGAIKSIDDKFSVNPSNGTASFSIPLPLSPGRNGSAPSLGLSYNSGGGNSPFGLGWDVSFPMIQRKTEKKLPEYLDDRESDTFIYSGVEDLVPEIIKDADGNWAKHIVKNDTLTITHYRPRIEGSFARIEKIEEKGNVYWRVRTRDNIVSVFGKSDSARLSSPIKGEDHKIFSWCLEYSFDDKGNFVHHHYKKENKVNVNSSLFEKNRLSGNAPFTNIYLKRVQYGNQTAFYEGDELPKNFLFELVFDFGEHDEDKPTVSEIKGWRCRKDPFSDYRAGFEIRTYRLCKRVLMFHHFKEELGLDDYLVRSLQFVYDERPHLTYLDSVIQSGYIWEKNGVLRSKESLPPFSFIYIKPGYSNEVKAISHENLINAPVGIDSQQYIWTDLYNEGISGILTEQGNGWYYKENLGNGEFAAAKLVSPRPSFNGLNSGTIALQDLEANGKKHLVSTGPYIKGFFEMGEENDWKPLQYFETYPNIDLRDPDLKFVDLTGDGLVDMLLTNHEGFTWYASKGKGGYDDAEIAFKSHDEEKGPKIYFSDPDKLRLVAIADMNGDGLGDIVLVTYNSVSYYPNLGYGRFGARVSLPLDDCIANFSNFNPRYIHFADVDGSGTTDIIYTGNDKIQVWFNQSGNSLSKVFEFLNPFPELDNFSEIEFVDLLGNGTSCLVWSSSLPAHSHAPLRYIDLMGGRKPHVMKGMKNNLGKEVKLEYRSSTQYYLEDKKHGEPWVTKLPFPVQCVSKVVIEDKVAETRFANEYSFHHGYYDCVEREFRGFARVEQRDSESYEHYVKETNAAGAVNTVEKELYQPTVITKSWFHTGAFINREKIFHFLEGEYYSQDKFKNIKASDKEHSETIKQYKLSEPLLPAHLTHAEMHEWCRALKGLPLRQEVYSEEGDEQIRMHPYSVIQNNHDIQILQPRLEQKHAVFLSHEKEKLSLYYERNPFDPRIAHAINVEIDQYGNVLQSASIAYGRLKADLSLPTEEDRAKQTRQNIIYNQHSVTATIDRDDAYRLPVPFETQAWELNTGRPSKALFEADDIKQRFEQAAIRSYEEETAAGEKRKIEHSRTLFLKNDLTGPMPFGEMDSLALPFENYLLAFTPSLVQHIYGDKYDEKLFREKAGYVRFGDDDNFWIRSGRIHFHVDLSLDIYAKTINAPIAGYTGFAQSNFYLPVAHEDNFGNLTKSFYDKNKLFVQKIVDAKDNEVSVDAFNYRVMAAYLARDPNDNRTGVRFDALGRVIRTFLMGKENEYLGDPMDVESDELSEQDQPTSVIEYQLRYFESKGKKPNRVKASKRENHFYDLNKNDVWHEAYSYSDGSGHEVLKKIQAEPGMAPERDKEGKLIFDETGKPRQKDTSPALRWVGSGKVIYNNKGPVKQYEPYFDNTWEFNNEEELVKLGYTSIIYYDALSRVIKTEKPNGTYSKMEFNAWGLKTYDENDTAGSIAPVTGLANTDWYKERISGAKGKAEQEAAQKTVLHYNTPTSISLDSQIRPYLSKAHNKTQRDNEAVLEEFYNTRTELTIEGNARYTRDARGNVVMSWKYDIVGNICYQHSMDAGDRSILTDVIGNPIRLWDSRQQSFTYEYDELRRLISICVDTGNEDMLFEKYEYGENNSDAKKKNLKGKLHHHYDMAGLVTNEVYDFKGNLLASVRQLLKDYRKVPDWKCNPILEVDAYKGKNIYDGFNRTIKIITPDGSIFTPGYNEAGLLKSIIVNIKGSDTPTEFVKDIYYNAKRQREEIFYSNQTRTRYKYDEKTYRLIEIFTTGDNGNRILQNLNYTYDPVGNILLQFDSAQKTIFYGGQRIEAQSEYSYDAVYRLIQASGREHTGQSLVNREDNWNDDWSYLHLQENNAMQLRNYRQKYVYDSVGNILRMRHAAGATGSWTRMYDYNSANNQLIKTFMGDEAYNYGYNEHGCMINMPHLQLIEWGIHEEMRHVSLRGGGEAWYVYDSSGQRVRKIVERSATESEERIYLGSFEIYRKRNENSITLERETLHIMDDKQRIAMIESRTKGDDGSPQELVRFQYTNHLGSAVLEMDEHAKIISYEEYHPYGTTAYHATDSSRQVAKKRYRYSAMERDEESGLNYHGARYYVPWLGRWMAVDPIGIKDTINLYNYGKSNPTSGNDVDGRAVNFIAAAIGAGVGAIGGGIIGAWRAKPGEGWAGFGKGAAIGGVAGGLAGLTFGASLAATGAVGIGGATVATGGTTGSVLISGTLAGAVGGGTNATLTSLSDGRSVEESLEMGSIGAFTGSLGGAVGVAGGVYSSNFVLPYVNNSVVSANLIGGAVGGLSSDLTGQTVMVSTGLQPEYSFGQTAFSTVAGGGLGGYFGRNTMISTKGMPYDFTPGESNSPILFGQRGVSPNFSSGGHFKGADILDVATGINAGSVDPAQMQVQYIWINGQRVVVNNRSLTALSLAGREPVNPTDRSGALPTTGPDSLRSIMVRLDEMGGVPSRNMPIRSSGDRNSPARQTVTIPEPTPLEERLQMSIPSEHDN